MSSSQSITDLKQLRIEFLVKQNASIYDQHSIKELEVAKSSRILQNVKIDVEATSGRLLGISNLIETLTKNATELTKETSVHEDIRRASTGSNLALENCIEALQGKLSGITSLISDQRGSIETLKHNESNSVRETGAMISVSATLRARLAESLGVLNQKQAEVSSVRKQACELDAQTVIDRDMMKVGLELIAKKVEALRKAQAQAERVKADLTGQLEKASRTLEEKVQVREKLQQELQSITSDRERFLKNRTEIYQKLKFAESCQSQAVGLFEAREAELARLLSFRDLQSQQIKSLRDGEYQAIDLVRQSQVSISKAEAEYQHSRKRLEAVKSLFENTSKRLEAVTQETLVKTDEISRQRSDVARFERLLSDISNQIQVFGARENKIRSDLETSCKQLTLLLEDCATLSLHAESSEGDRIAATGSVSEAESALNILTQKVNRIESEYSEQETRKKLLFDKVTDLSNSMSRIQRVNSSCISRPPVLLDAEAGSALLERLAMNKFLREAQAKPNSVSLLISKISELLSLVETTRSNADSALASLSLLTSQLSAMRSETVEACGKISDLKIFRLKSISLCIENELNLSSSAPAELCFENLRLRDSDVALIHSTVATLGGFTRISKLSLRKNNLTDESFRSLSLILDDFCYLASLDLCENSFSSKVVQEIASLLRAMPGITSIDTAGDRLVSMSGKVVRLTLDLRFQSLVEEKDEKFNFPEESRPNLKPPTKVLENKNAEKKPVEKLNKNLAVTKMGIISKSLQENAKIGIVPPSLQEVLKMGFIPKSSTNGNVPVVKKSSPTRKPVSSESSRTDSSFQRQLSFSHQTIASRALRLGINSLPHAR